jgi:hypothetical protein
LLCRLLVRKVYFLIGMLSCLLFASNAGADAFKLNNGETLNGEAMVPTANDQGMQIKVGDGQYQKVPWGNFSQDDLKNFAKNSKLEPFVQPFIEVNPDERIKRTEVNIKEPPRLELPPRGSLLGAMFSSGLGIFMLFLVYAAGIYAAYEVSIFRAQSPLMLCGLAAIPGLGFAVPIVFLCLPTKIEPSRQTIEGTAEVAAVAAQPGGADDVNPMHADGASQPSGLKLAESAPEEGKSALPETVVFQRGQFTFNRRFFETKFGGFFGVIRRDAEKDLLLVIKSTRGEYSSQRISRIAANDVHLQVQRGHASEEVVIPFQEIQEIRLKHKDAVK